MEVGMGIVGGLEMARHNNNREGGEMGVRGLKN